MATEAQLAEKLLQDRRGVRTPPPPSPTPPSEAPGRNGRPPPLPPRKSSPFLAPPPAYSSDDARRSEMISEAWRSYDPRSSSTHSLVPSESGRGRDGRRKLLLIFIHGFMGNETSFQSFPAHLHNLLTIALSKSHVVHTKIYPRYKSRRTIDFARDDFGAWLEPHEDAFTDVILVGHSMGGILAAEVAIQPSRTPATGQPFAHRILGTINLDTPFLGMHPGLISSGIASLFRPADSPGPKPAHAGNSGASTPSLATQDSVSGTSQRPSAPSSYSGSIYDADSSSQMNCITSPLATPSPTDPYFNRPFTNDVHLPERKGLNSILYFINKHAEGARTTEKLGSLAAATKSYFTSHLEFGGCLADYPGLKARYSKLRALEDVDDSSIPGALGYQRRVRRIRFVNYYTASTGRPKQPKIPAGQMIGQDGQLQPIETEMQNMSLSTDSISSTPIPSLDVEEDGTSGVTSQQLDQAIKEAPVEIQMQSLGESSGVQDDIQDDFQDDELPPMQHIESMPIEEDDESIVEPAEQNHTITEAAENATGKPEEATSALEPSSTDPPLPPIPSMPTEPTPIDLSIYTDKDSRKIAEKEHKRVTKAYQQAVKDRDSAIKDRKRLVEKREKKTRQEAEKRLKEEQKQRAREEKEEEKLRATINPEPLPVSSPVETRDPQRSTVKVEKPKKDRKFCMLPSGTNGKRDACWIRIYMEGVDEVGAHCGLFFPGPQYESLVMDVGRRIEEWVEEDIKKRATIDAAGS
ncbi:hypothetical protein BP6252_01376 [Coleophoma cylindrospora]|uniref:AB hydrolase-1 domain-containing protein n=1 Tax=Coleophoma cylindrospora TaxID=1849047 RepID=A0A3D8SSX9_9HELO|nr:hypothetical protein BP6252_01376 [Coleophoma cylindrospora]